MKFTEFTIVNFKGIEKITFNLDRSPNAKIYTLVGLNESGKTTILEAINFFNPDEKINGLEIPGTTIKDFYSLIPVSKRGMFDDTVSITVTVALEEDDLQKINDFAEKNTLFKKVKTVDSIQYYRYYNFKGSKFFEFSSKWTGFEGCLKTELEEKYIPIKEAGGYNEDNLKLAVFCRTMIPSILYFPNFLFDFPPRIYLEFEKEASPKEKFYFELIQDILFSLKNDSNIETHIIARAKSDDKNDKTSLNTLIKTINKKVTDVIFDAWSKVFKREIKGTEVKIKYDIDDNKKVYLEFEIESTDGIYSINERSLGFRWFFIFLLFTQFRPFRKNSPKNIIFLFDEPASNLHSSAQTQLLKSFENLVENAKIIYTTHSHHLINPHWLESTYVVKNEGLKLEDPTDNYNPKKVNITIEPYREFVINHPKNTAYFQPILDVLDYSPSNLENLPNCVFLEGKNDFYTLAYFNEILFNNKSKLNMAPSTSSGNLDTLISLYLGWGKEFIILLDSDKEGEFQKKRYTDKFGILVENRVFTLADVDSTFKNKKMEKLFDNSDILNFQKTCYPASTKFNKTHFNRAIQESLMNKKLFNFSQITKDNVSKILAFLQEKLKT